MAERIRPLQRKERGIEMKKVSEMNGTERIAYRNIKGVFNWEVGGWYNCIQDGCEEYIPDTLEEAKQIVYDGSLNDASGDGWYSCGRAPREMRFAGADFLHECVDYLFSRDDDVAAIAKEKGWTV